MSEIVDSIQDALEHSVSKAREIATNLSPASDIHELKQFVHQWRKELQGQKEQISKHSESTESVTGLIPEEIREQEILLEHIQQQLGGHHDEHPSFIENLLQVEQAVGDSIDHVAERMFSPFQTKKEWTNWAETINCRPKKMVKVHNKEDVAKQITAAVRKGYNVRCAAFGHSWASLSITDGYLLLVSDMNKIDIKTHPKYGHVVTVEPGVSIGDLDAALKKHKPSLCLPANAILTSAQYGGLLSCGCHGSGQHTQTLSDDIIAMTVMTWDGEKVREVEFSEDKNEKDLRYAKVNLGTLGVILNMTIKTRPMFNFDVWDYKDFMDKSIKNLDNFTRILKDNQAVELFWFPFNGTSPLIIDKNYKGDAEEIVVKTWNETEDVNAKPTQSEWERAGEWETTYLTTYAGGFAYRALKVLPQYAPLFTWGLHRFFLANLFTKSTRRLPADWALHYRNGIDGMPCVDMEFAIKIKKDFSDIERIRTAWYAVVDKVFEYRERGEYPMNLLLEMRMNKNSNCILSNMYDEEESYYCTIEVLSATSVEEKLWVKFCNEIAEVWISLGGRPHWAKQWEFIEGIEDKFPQMYGDRLRLYNEFRKKHDPTDLFMNDLLKDKVFKGLIQ